ncbi:MAG: hypothetical protein K2K21_01870 [Lachnospiraceae bacterium]|nr:hypothetical protein [Lachnospiraceae bacterium]
MKPVIIISNERNTARLIITEYSYIHIQGKAHSGQVPIAADEMTVVNGFAYLSNINYQYGFECGVKYVNGTEGKNVEIIELPAYAGTDVTGVWYIGCDIDQYDDGADGDRNVMLTSAIKVMHSDVERTLNAISAGFFGGGNV